MLASGTLRSLVSENELGEIPETSARNSGGQSEKFVGYMIHNWQPNTQSYPFAVYCGTQKLSFVTDKI